MNKVASKLLAVAAFSLLTTGVILPVSAAPSDKPKEEGKSVLPENIVEAAFISVIAITGLSVLLGTGRSIKYNMSASKTELDSDSEPSDIVEETAHHIHTSEMAESESNSLKELDLEHNGNGNFANGLITNGHFHENSDREHRQTANGHSNGMSANGDRHNHNTDDDSHSIPNKEKLSAKDLQVATSQEQLQELQKHLYRQKYQKLQEQVRLLPSFAQSPTKEVDTWEVDVEVALMVLAESPENEKEVEQVLLQSDQVREWAVSLPEQEFQAKAAEYIEKTFSWAQELRKWRERHVSA